MHVPRLPGGRRTRGVGDPSEDACAADAKVVGGVGAESSLGKSGEGSARRSYGTGGCRKGSG